MGDPKISIIIGIYNCEKIFLSGHPFINKPVFQDFKVIIYDEGFADETSR